MSRIYLLLQFYSFWIYYMGYMTSASGVFEVKLEEFVHGNRKASSVRDCPEPCTTSFRICLSHYQPQGGNRKECTFGSQETTGFVGNTLTFGNLGEPGSDIVELKFNFAWPRAFSLVIEAVQQRGSGEFTEKVLARIEKSDSLDVDTGWKTESQTQQEKTLRYSYRVRCSQHYYGGTCSKYCRPRDDMFGHYTCNGAGEKVCLAGWKPKKHTENWYCLQPICRTGCSTSHGYCTRPNECSCRQGWKGDLCDQCQTHPQCSHGTCNDIFECICKPGWGGMLCNQDLNYCVNHRPCKNGARCTNTGQGSFSCDCTAGFTGRECDVRINECDQNPCLNGAKCKVDERGYSCECPDNFFGIHCGNTSATCDASPCRNGGSCFANGAGYRCMCRPGFRGVNCEVREAICRQGTCLNGATCQEFLRSYRCICPPGFRGRRCDSKTEKCEADTCRNGGKCFKKEDGFHCECAVGFSGPRCEISSPGNNKTTRIILLTNRDKPPSNPLHWITVFFAVLVLALICVAVCIAYQRYGKFNYVRGRAVTFIQGLTNKSSDSSTERPSDPESHMPLRVTFSIPEEAAAPAPPEDRFSAKTTEFHPSKRVEKHLTSVMRDGVNSAREEAGYYVSCPPFDEMNSCETPRSVECKLPTYQEDCSQRYYSSQLL